MSSSTTQRGGIRSRGGCSTCKTKKLKCDEHKPECLTCIKKGYTCPGYQRPLRWSRKHERQLKGETAVRLSSSSRNSQSNTSSIMPASNSTEQASDMIAAGNLFTPAEDIFESWPGYMGTSSAETHDSRIVTGFEDQSLWSAGSATGLADDAVPISPTFRLGSRIDLDGFSVPAVSTSRSGGNLDDCTQENQDTTPKDTSPSVRPDHYVHEATITNITDLPSFLITTWFTRICPMWSAFDSDTNMNRRMALETWQNNEAVFYSLQSMASSYMHERLPYLSSVPKTSRRRAVEVIKRDSAIFLASQEVKQIPTGIMLSLICLGTSLCWSDPKEIGSAFLRQTKRLLRHLNHFAGTIPLPERQTLLFLNNCCFYWDMLCRTVSKDEEIGTSWQLYQNPGGWSTQLIPHPWTGVSATAQHFFVSAITLCRKFHGREKRPHKVKASSLRAALKDIEDATNLEQQIRSSQNTLVNDTLNTGDSCTPGTHLIFVAEAYRLAALLQLYTTFDDLGSPTDLDAGDATGSTNTANEPDHSQSLQTTFELLGILANIPATSGTRSIQPLLYLTASIALRYSTMDKTGRESDPFDDSFIPVIPELYSFPVGNTIPDDQPSFDYKPAMVDDLRIGEARHFIMTRLEKLEISLPSRPIKVAKELVQAIWASYDTFSNETHWLDVMQKTGLFTIFG